MKTIIRNVTVILLIAAMCTSLCSCNVFRTMRENAEKASKIQIAETPDDEEAIALLQSIVSDSAGIADEMKETVSYDAGNPDIYRSNGEDGQQNSYGNGSLLDASAKQLRDLIMENKPGKTEETLTADDLRLLNKLDAKGALDVAVDRNYGEEKVTDEKGNYVADENGEIVTEKYISDNILHFTIAYYDTIVTDWITNDEGLAEEVTDYVAADNATIESVFSEPADEKAVLEAFDAIKEYVTVTDYYFSYKNCKIVADVNLDENIVSFVRFEKHMTVTAHAICHGPLEDYGELLVVFPLTKNIEYSFSYPAAE